CCNEGDYW
nr:immunoglobulin heavy chain junction region [Macaca mulatta]MPN69895.1 immunoglobulin heavy chain junction region [Macaca mulatta]MPN70306.1 immunoglobulin heavy chain junction region [Macaca mulatta]MPN70377.1 immunoglobulin heavy chain junction region [Macaca mulatta]MPN71712.1 immunoglobulin heavy chain junction region [Macaca mulatta]